MARRKTSITEEGSNLGGILLEQGIVKFFVEYQSREEKHTSSKAAEEPESGFGRLHGEDEMQRNPIKMTLSEEPNRARTARVNTSNNDADDVLCAHLNFRGPGLRP